MVIIARRWFDKKNGNTYHSVEVYGDNNEFIGKNPFEYGYDEHYLQTAHEILQKEGYYPKTDNRLASGLGEDYHQFLMDIRDSKFLVSCTDVGRRKDL